MPDGLRLAKHFNKFHEVLKLLPIISAGGVMATSFEGNSGEEREGQQAGQAGGNSPEATTRWNPATRIAFRFFFVYLGLYSLTSGSLSNLVWYMTRVPVPLYPAASPMRQITSWTAAHIFHLGPTSNSWGGDSMNGWVQAFWVLLLASLVTVVWSVLDRRRQNYVAMHKWFRLFIRFVLALQMFLYGFGKVFLLQMPFPLLMRLVEPYGHFSPMDVLWSSIGVAPAYQMFAGGAEVLGGLLLILPVTAMLGALVCAADMTQVLILNMSYDVGVKLDSFHLLLLALFLAAPEFPRLARFFFTRRPAPPSTDPPLLRSTRANRVALAAQILLGILLVGTSVYENVKDWRTWGPRAPRPELYGVWNIEGMTIDGQVHPLLLTDTELWRRVIFDWYPENAVAVQRMNDTFIHFTMSKNAKGFDLKDTGIPWFNIPGDPKLSGDFTFDRPTPDLLVLDGSMGGHKIHAELKRMDLQKFTLVNRGFHWVNEYPYQR
jgi:uncharacterized membrane protein YphA (DoxX/SURF4 family)